MNSLEMTKESFVDRELRGHFSDILSKIRLADGKKGYVYALLERKSYPDRFVAFQLLRYMVRIWEQARREYEEAGKEKRRRQKKKGKKAEEAEKAVPPFYFPPIIPVVIYHGASEWNIRPDFTSLFDMPPELRPLTPDFRYLLCDISHIGDDEIKGAVMLRVGMLVMKYVFRDDLGDRLPDIFRLLCESADRHTGPEYLETIATYLVRGTEKLTEEELDRAIKSAQRIPFVLGTS